MPGRRRRGSLARLRRDHAWVVIAEAPEGRRVGSSGRAAEQMERARHLRPADRDAIRSLAGMRSLRDLVVDFGVSHETVRAVLRR